MQVMGNSSYIVLDRNTSFSILHEDILLNSLIDTLKNTSNE